MLVLELVSVYPPACSQLALRDECDPLRHVITYASYTAAKRLRR